MFTYLRRIFKTSFQHIARNTWLSVASITVILLAFFLSSLFAGLVYGSNILLDYFETEAQILTFFKVGTEEEEILELRSRVIDYLAPENVEYTSEEAAIAEFKDAYKDNELITESITENVLPASLGIRAQDIDDIPQIISYLNDEKDESEIIDEIYYREDVVDRIKQASKIIRIAGLSLVAFLATVSFLIILITTGITISNYEQEIAIMQLVGASSSYIKLPFIFAGALYGGLGALLAMTTLGLMTYGGYYYLETSSILSTLTDFFRGVPFPTITVTEVVIVVAVEALAGIIIGSISSVFAVGKYMK